MRRFVPLHLLAVAAALVLSNAACGDADAPADAGTSSDLGAGRDAETRPDVGPAADGSEPVDLGSDLDASDASNETDAWDTGTVEDLGVPPDASDPADAGDVGPSCTPLVTFEAGLQPTAEIHVTTNGADGANCGASGSPCATLDYALGRATPGTAVILHAGTHAPDAFAAGLEGTANAPIWIGGAAGEARPVIAGGSQALHLAGARYVVLHDLEISGQSANGINVDDAAERTDIDSARHIVFRNLYIHDVGTGNNDCLKLSGINDYFVLNSRFERCGGGSAGSAIDHVGCHDGLIANNVFADNAAAGNAVQCKGGSRNIEIRANVFDDPGARGVNMGGSTGFDFFRPPLSMSAPNTEASDIRVIANVFIGSPAPIAFVGCVDCLAAHNTFVNPTNWVMRILQETTSTAEYEFLPASDGRVINNIIYFERADLSTFVNVGGNTAPNTFEFRNNLWYAHDDPGESNPGNALPVSETGGLYGMDPSFDDPAASDFHIPSGSPAAGAGVALPEVAQDADGRCYASPPSVGAFEVP